MLLVECLFKGPVMGQCNEGVFSGCRKRRTLNCVHGNIHGRTTRPTTTSSKTVIPRGVHIGAIILYATLLLTFPAALRGDSLDQAQATLVRSGESLDVDNSPTSFFVPPSSSTAVKSTVEVEAAASSVTENVEQLSFGESFSPKTAESSIVTGTGHDEDQSPSSTTPSERVIRSSSPHSVTGVGTSPFLPLQHSSTSVSPVSKKNNKSGTSVVTVTETIPETPHRSHKNHHESVHSIHNPGPLHESYVKPATGSDPEAQAKRMYDDALQEFGVKGRTFREVCKPWEQTGCKCSGSLEEMSLSCRGVTLNGVPYGLPDSLVKL